MIYRVVNCQACQEQCMDSITVTVIQDVHLTADKSGLVFPPGCRDKYSTGYYCIDQEGLCVDNSVT